MKYEKQDFIDSMNEAAEILDKSPTYEEYESLDLYPCAEQFKRRYGWDNIKKAAGIKTADELRRSDIDEEYFCEIDTEEKAYWLGMLYGDGHIGQNRNGVDRVQLALKESDEDHVREFKEAIGAGYQITSSQGRKRVRTTNQRFADCLKSHGLGYDKTFSNSVPDLEDNSLRSAFVRGISDADGYVHKWQWTLTGSNRERLETIQNWIPVDTSIYQHEDRDTMRIVCLRVESLVKLYSWMYPDGVDTKPALHRKLNSAVFELARN